MKMVGWYTIQLYIIVMPSLAWSQISQELTGNRYHLRRPSLGERSLVWALNRNIKLHKVKFNMC